MLLTLALVSTSALQTQPASVGGTWTVRADISGNQSESTCTFTQKEADLTGSCAGERGTVMITGKVDGKTVNWQFDTQYQGQTLDRLLQRYVTVGREDHRQRQRAADERQRRVHSDESKVRLRLPSRARERPREETDAASIQRDAHTHVSQVSELRRNVTGVVRRFLGLSASFFYDHC